jgi:hypothetical protein
MTGVDRVALPRQPQHGAAVQAARGARPVQRWQVDPPRWVFHGACALFALWLAWIWSRPTFDLTDATVPLVLLAGCALIWTGRLAATLVRRERLGRWWLVAPVGAALVLTLFSVHAPLRARFALAQSDLGTIARAVLAAPDPVAAAAERGDPGRVGTYRILGVQSADGVVYFQFAGGVGSTGRNGMAYIPAGTPIPPARTYVQTLRHLQGPWYVWSEDPVSRR